MGTSFRLPQSLTEISPYGVTAGAGVEFGLLSPVPDSLTQFPALRRM